MIRTTVKPDDERVQYVLSAGGTRTWRAVSCVEDLTRYNNVQDFYMMMSEGNLIIFGSNGSAPWSIRATFCPQTEDDENLLISSCYGKSPTDILTIVRGLAASYVRAICVRDKTDETLIAVNRDWSALRRAVSNYVKDNKLDTQLWSWWYKDSELPPKMRECIGMGTGTFLFAEKVVVTNEGFSS